MSFFSEQAAHPISITDTGDNSCKYDSVKARECTLNLVSVTVDEIFHNRQYLQKLTNFRTNSVVYS